MTEAAKKVVFTVTIQSVEGNRTNYTVTSDPEEIPFAQNPEEMADPMLVTPKLLEEVIESYFVFAGNAHLLSIFMGAVRQVMAIAEQVEQEEESPIVKP